MTRLPVEKYDLTVERKKEMEIANSIDTIVFLTLGSGYLRGSEHNHYTIIKKNTKTIIQRTSNFQKFQLSEISSSNFPWQYIFVNYNKFVNDTIRTKKKIITEDGKVIFQQAASHGKTTYLKVKLGQEKHKIYLAPLVESYNEGNINLDLIRKLNETVQKLNFIPSEKIKYRWEK